MALAAYRHLLRSTRIAFQGDLPVLRASRLQARASFDENISLLPSSTECRDAIVYALDVSRVLRENVVQGRKIDTDSDKENAQYKLRIHEYTERGDNDSIKTSGKKKQGRSINNQSCCS
ncbi:Mitochondrial zinc maintenance protein 1, mitochondrial [Erysiphe neolycopersici]|uniref:Mitochondrial zinc maintenance protein 1, mitochondrial n=1 Tax=Erysiphe neolycopersici TaxID=212602 RepID=A0A420I1G9_9PEZI|nr:Mitochondrial zinc maintenance protein 1, mitochondrial [Erysiphe neolycopersici]